MTKKVSDADRKFARMAKAMGHPVRVYIVRELLSQPCCYSGNLSEELDIPKSTLSQHLKELKDSGIIVGEVETPKIRYCLSQAAWDEFQETLAPFVRTVTAC